MAWKFIIKKVIVFNMLNLLSRIKKNKKLAILYRAIKYINNDDYVNKVFNIHTLNINLGSIRKYRDIYYKIEICNNNSGFFAHIYWVMNGLYVADRLGFIPYVCIKGSKYNNLENHDDNMYEHYYMQDVTVDKDASYIKYELGLASYIWKEFDMEGYVVSDAYINAMADILNRYMPLRPAIEERIGSDIKKIITDPSTTLAVHARGTAYSVGFYGHPVQVQFKDYCVYIDVALKKGFKTIFLATDDEKIKSKFLKKYGDSVIFYYDVLRSSNSLDVIDLEDKRDDNAFLMGYEVLRDAMTMAYCDGFIAGFSKVSMYTRIKRKANGNDFRYMKVIDKGIVEKKKLISELKYKINSKLYDIKSKK